MPLELFIFKDLFTFWSLLHISQHGGQIQLIKRVVSDQGQLSCFPADHVLFERFPWVWLAEHVFATFVA